MPCTLYPNRFDDLTMDFGLMLDGEPLDLRGATVEVIDNPKCPDLTVEIDDPVEGIVVVRQPATATATMPQKSYFRLRYTLPDGTVKSTERIEFNVE